MTPEQHQNFINYALEIKWNRDQYSRAWIIEHLMAKIDELVKENEVNKTKRDLEIIDHIIDDLKEENLKYEYQPNHCKNRDQANKSFAIKDCIKIVEKYYYPGQSISPPKPIPPPSRFLKEGEEPPKPKGK